MSDWDNPGVEVLGRVPSGLYIVTCRGKSGNHGFLASWVQQAGFAPPAISVAIKQDRPIMRDMAPGRMLTLNLLAEGDDDSKALMRAYARGFEIGEDAFAGQELADGANGSPYLVKALGYIECRVLRVLEPSTEHNLVIGQVLDGKLLREGKPSVHIRKSGKNY